jgi:carboxylesterase
MTRIGLVHGLGGTAATMAPLAQLLAAHGHDVATVTLPGHGTNPEDLVGIGWSDWLAAVPHADVLIGQSMGASLALTVAAVHDHLLGVVAINAPAADPDALEGLEWRHSRGHDWIDGPDLAPGEVGYSRFPVTALIEMVEGSLAIDLAAVDCPLLLVNSAHDDVVDPMTADVIADSVTGDVTRLTLPNSGHVATMGPDLQLLADAVLAAISQW